MFNRLNSWCKRAFAVFREIKDFITLPTTDAQPAMPFPLVNLPLGVRKRVLEFAVVEENPIEITTFKTVKGCPATTSARIAWRSTVFWVNYHAIRMDAVDWIGRSRNANKFAVARVNKQLAAEALPIVYGHNRFSFDNISDMNTFLLEIGKIRGFIQYLQVQDRCGWNTGTTDYPRILWELPKTNLKHITLNCHTFASNKSLDIERIRIDTLFKIHIMPFLHR